jgi:sugar O-acyltransferase (sialic acid O-acetyltransferase NeuD family)
VRYFAIFGVGGCGRSVIPFAKILLGGNNIEHELAFVDDNPSSLVINKYPVFKYDEWLLHTKGHERFINIAISDYRIRKMLVERCIKDGVKFFEVRAPSVVELDNVTLGEGALLSSHVILTSNIHIGKYFHANSFSYIEHDCVIGDYVTFAPGVKCNGNVIVGDYAYVGAGAIIKQGLGASPLIIGEGAIVGMGAVVTKNVAPYTTVVGNPARRF